MTLIEVAACEHCNCFVPLGENLKHEKVILPHTAPGEKEMCKGSESKPRTWTMRFSGEPVCPIYELNENHRVK